MWSALVKGRAPGEPPQAFPLPTWAESGQGAARESQAMSQSPSAGRLIQLGLLGDPPLRCQLGHWDGGVLSLCLSFWGPESSPWVPKALSRAPESDSGSGVGRPLARVARRLEQDEQLVCTWPMGSPPEGPHFHEKGECCLSCSQLLLRQEGQRAAHDSMWSGA